MDIDGWKGCSQSSAALPSSAAHLLPLTLTCAPTCLPALQVKAVYQALEADQPWL